MLEHYSRKLIGLTLVPLIAIAFNGIFAQPTLARGPDFGKICTVADPTGTPLNVRQQPNGKIIGTLDNGVQIEVLRDRTDRQGKVWIQISAGDSETVRGYVLRKFLNCSG
jgi:hypothetical protein